MREKDKIMIVGCGELGGILLEYLCRIPNVADIVVTDVNEDWGFRKTNSAILGASYMGFFPKIEFKPIDLLDIEKTADLIREINPTLIYNATTLQSWWVVNELPDDVRNKLYRNRCALGPWEAMHLALTSKLMKAVKLSGVNTYVVNSAYPDVTNPSLAKVGLAPTVGIGNLDLTVPYVQKAASEMLNIPMANIRVEFIGHHYHCYAWCRNGSGAEAPHHLKVFAGHQDITDQLGGIEKLIAELPKRAARPGGRFGQYLVAASALKNILAIINDTNEITHAPGPQGLEGGYPVRLSRKGAEVVLPEGMSLDQARSLMCQAQQWDGVQEIRDNGDVVFTDESYETFKEMLNVDCRFITVENSFEQAMELKKKFNEFAEYNGVKVPV